MTPSRNWSDFPASFLQVATQRRIAGVLIMGEALICLSARSHVLPAGRQGQSVAVRSG